MSRTKIEWRSASKENYFAFCKKHPEIDITFVKWKNIIYTYNDCYRNYVLETGEKIKIPFGLGEVSIVKKKRKTKKVIKGKEYINLPVDWKKTKAAGKKIYIFNRHTNGYFFGWSWFRKKTNIKNPTFWYFKPSRTTSRLIQHYLTIDKKYQFLYKEWSI